MSAERYRYTKLFDMSTSKSWVSFEGKQNNIRRQSSII
jgi:hypothetical protein